MHECKESKFPWEVIACFLIIRKMCLKNLSVIISQSLPAFELPLHQMELILILLLLFTIAHGQGFEETLWLHRFVADVIDTWKIRSPTIIYRDYLPELCIKHVWILCLSNEHNVNELAQHSARISNQRKQDGIIFLAEDGHEKLLKRLSGDDSLFFSSNYRMFKPSSYKTDINLRLDSNIIFCKDNMTSNYELHRVRPQALRSPLRPL